MRAWTTKDRSAAGHVGDPSVATAAKGETLLAAFTADAINLLERVAGWSGRGWN
jgi:creatinine amidohydrolase/Fe(II)-dependent formamide hydrolase-like protein